MGSHVTATAMPAPVGGSGKSHTQAKDSMGNVWQIVAGTGELVVLPAQNGMGEGAAAAAVPFPLPAGAAAATSISSDVGGYVWITDGAELWKGVLSLEMG